MNYAIITIHHFILIFVFFLYFFYHSSCSKDQFLFLIQNTAHHATDKQTGSEVSPSPNRYQ